MPLINQNQRNQLKLFFNDLDKQNIRYIVLRGYREYPERIRTDLDIACHMDDQKQYYETAKKHFGITAEPCITKLDNNICIYWDFKVDDKSDNEEKIQCIRLDLYNGIYFFHKKKYLLTKESNDYIFNNRVKHHCFYIPSLEIDIVTNILRCVYDKGTTLDEKRVGKKYRDYIENSLDKLDYIKMKEYLMHVYPVQASIADHLFDLFIDYVKEKEYLNLSKLVRRLRIQ